MNLPKFPHCGVIVGVTACGKTEFLLQLLETEYKNHFEFTVILCPMSLDSKNIFLGSGSSIIRMFILCVTWKEN